jgi:hypothetical protein
MRGRLRALAAFHRARVERARGNASPLRRAHWVARHRKLWGFKQSAFDPDRQLSNAHAHRMIDCVGDHRRRPDIAQLARS